MLQEGQKQNSVRVTTHIRCEIVENYINQIGTLSHWYVNSRVVTKILIFIRASDLIKTTFFFWKKKKRNHQLTKGGEYYNLPVEWLINEWVFFIAVTYTLHCLILLIISPIHGCMSEYLTKNLLHTAFLYITYFELKPIFFVEQIVLCGACHKSWNSVECCCQTEV